MDWSFLLPFLLLVFTTGDLLSRGKLLDRDFCVGREDECRVTGLEVGYGENHPIAVKSTHVKVGFVLYPDAPRLMSTGVSVRICQGLGLYTCRGLRWVLTGRSLLGCRGLRSVSRTVCKGPCGHRVPDMRLRHGVAPRRRR